MTKNDKKVLKIINGFFCIPFKSDKYLEKQRYVREATQPWFI